MRLPRTIKPCPILEAIVEVRFEPDIPEEAVFGIVYQSFKKDYNHVQVENLPILQVPEAVLRKDPNLKYKPHYRLQRNGLILGLGPRVWSLSNASGYLGWAKYSEALLDTIDRISSASIMKAPLRFGLRYINAFDDDIFDNITLKVSHDDGPFSCDQLAIRAQVPTGDFTTTLQISNRASFKSNGGQNVGSVIDLDIWTESEVEKLLTGPREFIEKSHAEEKKLFFSLLTEEFLASLNPEY